MGKVIANELRIGNRLQNGTIESIDKNIVRLWDGCVARYSSISDLQSIPLTEDILLKCGFEKWNGQSNNLHIDAWQIPQSARFDIDWIHGNLYLKSRYD